MEQVKKKNLQTKRESEKSVITFVQGTLLYNLCNFGILAQWSS